MKKTCTVLGLDSCTDLDLAFTPAANLIPLRRIALAEGRYPGLWEIEQ